MPKIVTRYGVLEALDPESDLICKVLATYGEWAENEVRFVAGALPEGARVADIGAFIGTFTLGVAQLKRIETVCLVEANPMVIPLLRRNIETNLSLRATVVEAIVGPSEQAYEGSIDPANAGSFSLAVGTVADRVTAPTAVKAISLASLAREHGPFDLVKLDTEGMEGPILRDSIDYVLSSGASFWVECNETPDSIEIAELFLSHGFDLSYFAFPALSTTNFNGRKEVDFPFAYEAGLWATRRGAPTLTPELAAAGCILVHVRDAEALREAMWTTPRWAPADWVGQSREEIVALAAHTLLGEYKDGYLWDANYRQGEREWIKPLPSLLNEQIAVLRNELSDSKAQERASEIILFDERQRAARAIRALEDELRASYNAQNELRETLDGHTRAGEEQRRLSEEQRRLSEEQRRLWEEQRRLLEEQRRLTAEQAHSALVALLAIQQSTSWRVTRPMRILLRLLRGDFAELKRLWAAHR